MMKSSKSDTLTSKFCLDHDSDRAAGADQAVLMIRVHYASSESSQPELQGHTGPGKRGQKNILCYSMLFKSLFQ